MPTPMSIQDLIQHARRLARRPGPSGFCLVDLGAVASIKANAARYHYFRNSLFELAAEHAAELVELAGGRLCLFAEGGAIHAAVAALIEGERAPAASELPVTVESFVLPGQYQALRERLAALEATPEAAAGGGEPTPESLPAAADAQALAGPLTPRLLASIEDRLDGVDLEPFVRRRPVYARCDGWQPVYVEQRTDLETLAAVLFPGVELLPAEPLFFELRRHLDRLMLVALLLNRPWRRQTIGLDLGYAAWATDEYRRLLERLDDAERSRLTIELDWLDALRDVATGGKVMAEMREAGLRIAIDGIAIDALPLLQLDRLDANWLKLVFDRSRAAALAEPAQLDALRRLDPGRVILTDADDKLALELGQQLGIRHYQGPLIDRLAKAGREAARTVAAA